MLAVEDQIVVSDNKTNEMLPITLDPPKWLDRILVQRSLQNYFSNNQLRIIQFKVKPATAKGENYASCIYRVNVVYCDMEKNAVENQVRKVIV